MGKVSVIIPIYNVEEYIEECLVSVLNQTLKEIEIICVDDGTKDNSMGIIESYAKKDNRIVIVHKENGGLSSARNAGLKVANGEYVYFLDSDDYILDNTLELLYDEAKSNDLDTIFFDADSFFESEELAKKHENYMEYYHRKCIYDGIFTGQDMFIKMIHNNEFRPSACLQINKREMLLQNNISFKEGIIHEDNLFTLRTSLYAKRVKYMNQCFYQRRLRDDSIMTSAGEKKSAYGYFVCLREVIPEIAANITEKAVLQEYTEQLRRMYKNAARAIENENISDIVISQDPEENIWFDLIIKEYALLENDREVKVAIERKKLQAIKNSSSYKVGRVVTYIPRKLRSVFRILKEKSITGLFKAIIWKISQEFYVKHFTKVSIIIPVYNGEKYLRECIDSLRKQNFRDIEIICIDDQSTDGSMKILNDYVKKDKRVRVFEQEHLGAGSARNIGIKNARGKYLLFLDCDDYFDENLCGHAYKKAKKSKAEIVLFAAERQDMQNGKIEKMGWVLRSNELPKDKVFNGKDIPERLFQITSNCPWSKMFSRDFVIKNSLEFQNTRHANDVYFVRTAMALAERMVVLNEVLATYRFNTGESTQNLKDKAPLEFYKAFSAVKEKLEKENLFTLYKQSFINWTLTESLFNYNTMKTDEAKAIIKEKLMTDGFEYLGIKDCKKEDIYDSSLYEQYREFIRK